MSKQRPASERTFHFEGGPPAQAPTVPHRIGLILARIGRSAPELAVAATTLRDLERRSTAAAIEHELYELQRAGRIDELTVLRIIEGCPTLRAPHIRERAA